MEWSGFDWDDGNWPKCGKHGVSQTSIESVFDRDDTRIFRDEAHSSAEEDRYFAVVLDIDGHAGLLVGFTIRSVEARQLVRPVTARYMHAKEAACYAGF